VIRESTTITREAPYSHCSNAPGRPYIAPIEMGKKRNPSLDVLKRLARALGVPVTELLS
jgi:transcriptional regulator with XRE-family HTH domain